ncbi:solute carrier organic anion transporter family member 74D-like [Ornithodoros turicata]|uniref:solute carrier organic anion transporter family member 74D-like n=1 Tax=Ornithodoros turicata TaxID=34597 RepID=UPI00313A29C1
MASKTAFQPVPATVPGPQDSCDNPDFLCGIKSYRPRWLQRFAKPYYFLLFYVIFGIFQGALKAYLNGCITTIEKKFALSGKMLGIVLIADNVSSLFASLLIGYYATKISRPKIIVFGVCTAVAGCYLCALPHVIYGPGTSRQIGGQQGENQAGVTPRIQKEYCLSENDKVELKDESSTTPVAMVAVSILFIANMLIGLGGSAFYIAGTTYTDDNVKKKDSPVYFSLIMSSRLIGPMLGFIMASVCLSIYESPFENPGITNENPTWIGAWWLGFVIWGSAMALLSVPMALFPKYIRRPSVCHEDAPDGHQAPKRNVHKSLKEKLARDMKDFSRAVKRLAVNPVLMWQLVGIVFIYNGLGGHVSMFPKFVENQYRVTASKASLFTGPTQVLSMILGMFLGGMIVRFWKPRASTIGLMGAAGEFINIAFLFTAMSMGCSNWQLAGTQMNPDGSLSLRNSCNSECGCTTRAFQPICYVQEQATYFSSCFAGCSSGGNDSMICTCVHGNDTSTAGVPVDPTDIKDGYCEFACDKFFVVVLIMCIGMLLGQLSRVGSTLVGLRCVDPADKAMAMGMSGFCINFLAAIPYPLIYSATFDSQCIIWEERNGQKGNCWFYDLDKLRLAYNGLTIMFLACGMLCTLLVAYYARRVTDMYGDDPVAPESKDTAEMQQLNSDGCRT